MLPHYNVTVFDINIYRIFIAQKSAEMERNMDKKVTGIVAYLTLIGWLIAFLAGDKEGAKFHLNQALVIILAAFCGGIIVGIIAVILPSLGSILSGLLSIAEFVFIILGLISAIKEEEKPLPLIGGIKILK